MVADWKSFHGFSQKYGYMVAELLIQTVVCLLYVVIVDNLGQPFEMRPVKFLFELLDRMMIQFHGIKEATNQIQPP